MKTILQRLSCSSCHHHLLVPIAIGPEAGPIQITCPQCHHKYSLNYLQVDQVEVEPGCHNIKTQPHRLPQQQHYWVYGFWGEGLLRAFKRVHWTTQGQAEAFSLQSGDTLAMLYTLSQGHPKDLVLLLNLATRQTWSLFPEPQGLRNGVTRLLVELTAQWQQDQESDPRLLSCWQTAQQQLEAFEYLMQRMSELKTKISGHSAVAQELHQIQRQMAYRYPMFYIDFEKLTHKDSSILESQLYEAYYLIENYQAAVNALSRREESSDLEAEVFKEIETDLFRGLTGLEAMKQRLHSELIAFEPQLN
jgi:hypothetical protein